MILQFHRMRAISYLFIVQFGICLCQPTLKYRVNEETKPGFELGNIQNYVQSNFYESEHYTVSLIHNYFSILPNKSLVIKKQIDLEKFCNEANLCCGVNQCIVQFFAFIDAKNSMKNRFNIEIEILDINDNKPTFKSLSQTVYIPENSKINTPISLEGGSDNDFSPNNQIQQYKFEEQTKTFELDASDMASLSLILQKPIDFERRNVYNARLLACDNITRCTYQQVIINIQDENDNYPIFEKQRYETEIPESFEVGTVVIAARAKDLDGAQFNKTKYGFYDNRDSNLKMKFKVNPQTGDIILINKLTALQRQSYKFKIYAMDAGSYMSGKKELADVVINVLDINDNKPVIEVFESTRITDNKETFEMTIFENEPPHKLMSLKVTDADLGLNAKVVCELKDSSSSLELKFFSPEIYELSSIRKFDYELETQVKATLECKDSGTPPKDSYKYIKINIEDVNEYQPEFDQHEFHSSIKENTPSGIAVLTVHAVDRDGAAVLNYSIEENALKYFSINSKTGEIKTTSFSFDREKISSKTFRVTVTDSVNNPKTTDATVRINILDENDNDPIIMLGSLQFFILENRPLKSKLHGQLLANDNDKDSSNSFILYFLIDTFDSQLRKCLQPVFRVKSNGEMETLSMLDREINDNFTLLVEARDKGNPPRSTRANATVIVHDVNDNSPQWVYPRPYENRRNTVNTLPMINLTESTDLFFVIMKLKAFDPDQNEAGRVSYILVNHHESMFSLNDTTGELRTEKSPLPYGQYQLKLRAMDHGNPSLNSESWILINIIDSGKLANINLTIIIGMVGITALISIFLVVAIICVRRRPRYHQSYLAPSTDVSKEMANPYFTHNQWMYTDDNGMQHSSDNENGNHLPSNYYEQQDQPIMYTGSRPASRPSFSLVSSSNHINNIDYKSSSQNVERTNGTLRSNNGQYYSMNAPTSGIIINGPELDGDSADSGKGASEVDLRLQQHYLNNVSRNYPTMPFPHNSSATSTFGYQGSLPGPQYYSVSTNPRSYDSRYLTVHPSNLSGNRRVMSPTFNTSNPCQCFILPEDDVIQTEIDNNQLPMTTFSPKFICNIKPSVHDHNIEYNDDILSCSSPDYYSHCAYIPGTDNRVSPTPIYNKGLEVKDQEVKGDNINNHNQIEVYNNMFENKNKNNYLSSEQLNQDNNIYTLGLSK